MRRTVDIGGKTVEMESSAAAPIRYKRCFGQDMLAVILGAPSDAEATEVFMRLGYIYAKAAAGDGVYSEDDYMDWLDQFEIADYLEATAQIAELYSASSKTAIDPK